jgi:hypothetical protein
MRNDFLYIDCSIPEGITLGEYRRSRRTADRHPRRRMRRLFPALSGSLLG